jgi:hypothetical protein
MSDNVQATWLADIRRLFTQYDVVMMQSYFDLDSYEDVKKHAEIIWLSLQEDPNRPGWSVIPHVHRMPLGRSAWPAKNIAVFKAWIDAGCPYGKALPVYQTDPDIDVFLRLSVVLTGFADLAQDPKLANALLVRLRSNSGTSGGIQGILDATKNCGDTAAIEKMIANQSEEHLSLCRSITLLWYTGAFYPKDSPFPTDFGTEEQNQYRDGLMWRAGQAHPFGYSVEQQYWQNVPEANGRYTGLGIRG